ncbi:MAG: hypothetical protein DCC68_21740 [Planctomycetota bacterium]|nr:MAG: hypothetical protein DCC68_21740 [Planctomycetota bacterium]
MRLHAELLPVHALAPGDRAAMFDLMRSHFANVRRERFDADLDDKRWAILVFDAARRLCGFSTQTLFEAAVDDRCVLVLFSGDTVVERRHWGDPALTAAWGSFALSLVDEHPDQELYWLLISKGFRTYRYLPLFFREFHPRYDEPMRTPSTPRTHDLRRVLDCVAARRFGAAYAAAAGLIRGDAAKDRLRPELADIRPGRLADPHVRFFVERNPHYAEGDELCCLAPLSRENFTDAAMRVIALREPAACLDGGFRP